MYAQPPKREVFCGLTRLLPIESGLGEARKEVKHNMTEVPRENPEGFRKAPRGPKDAYHEPYKETGAKPFMVWERELADGRTEVTVFPSDDPYHGYVKTDDNYNHPCG